MDVFHCYEFLLMRKFQEDTLLWDGMKTHTCSNLKHFQTLLLSIQKKTVFKLDDEIMHTILLSDLWFLAVALEKAPHRLVSFLNAELQADIESAIRIPGQTVLARYLSHYNFVEMHLDSIFKYGETPALPRELFKCKNVRILSLKCNYLETIPADIGRLSNLERLSLTNNRLENRSIPFTLTFCSKLNELHLDNNLLDALPGFLVAMPQLTTVHRHGNLNYFKATFMWYHTDINDRVLRVCGEMVGKQQKKRVGPYSASSLLALSAKAVIASKIDFFLPGLLPNTLQDFISDVYPDYNVCENCQMAINISIGGFKVFTFKNPYLGNTCVPFQHYACCRSCAEAIEVPAHLEQQRAAKRMDLEYKHYISEFEATQDQTEVILANKSSCIIL